MFAKISHTWQIMGASWQILKRDKELLLFAVASAVCCAVVLVSFAIPIILADGHGQPAEESGRAQEVLFYGVLFLFYFCNYFVITFFNAAIIACAVKRMGGGEPTFRDGLGYAFGVLPQIAGWALVSATVGLVLRIIEDRSEKAGRLVAGLLGMAWTLVTFLVVPVLVVEKKGPIASFRKSTALLKKTWGEQLVGGFSFEFLFFLLALPAVAIAALGFMIGPAAFVICIVLAVLYLLSLALIQSTLHAIFRGVLYAYAETGNVPDAFPREILTDAMARR